MVEVLDVIRHAAALTGVESYKLSGCRRDRYLCAIRAACYTACIRHGITIQTIADETGVSVSQVYRAIQSVDLYARYYPDIHILFDTLVTRRKIWRTLDFDPGAKIRPLASPSLRGAA